MLYVSDVDDWKNGIFGCNGIQVMGIFGKVIDAEEGVIECGMVHVNAPLTVLLVVQI